MNGFSFFFYFLFLFFNLKKKFFFNFFSFHFISFHLFYSFYSVFYFYFISFHSQRAMQKKLSQVHNLRVPRDLVHAVMYNVDPDALEERAPCFKKNKKEEERPFHYSRNELDPFP